MKESRHSDKRNRDVLTEASRRIAVLEEQLAAQKKMSDDLCRDYDRYKNLVDNAGEWIWEADEQLSCVYTNQKVRDVLGYHPEEILGRSPVEFMAPGRFTDNQALLENIRGAAVKVHFREDVFVHKDGSIRFLETTMMTVVDFAGHVTGFRGNSRDITGRKLAEQTLRKSEERFQLVSQASNDAIYDWDITSGTIWLSESQRAFLGFPENEKHVRWWRNRLHPSDRERILANVRSVLKGVGSVWMEEYQFLCADGRYIDVIDRGQILRSKEGTPVRIVGSMMDITARKKAEEGLEKSEAKYRFLTEAMSDIVWMMDENLAFTYLSPSVENTLGMTVDEVIRRGASDIMTAESLSSARSAVEKLRMMEGRDPGGPPKTVTFEAAYRHRNGAWIWLENIISLVRNERGENIGIHGVSRNITEIRQAAVEREKLITDLKKALSDVKVLSGLLPICTRCKKIRDDQGYWNQIEGYISEHSDALFSHSLCPECAAKLYPRYKPKT